MKTKFSLFEATNTAHLSEERIRALPLHRLKAYRKKLLKSINKYSFCECCGEPLKLLYSSRDFSHIDEMQKVLDTVNKVFAEYSTPNPTEK